ncbi:MAG: rhodanese-like domain-containing protein [Nitrospirota bacterium]|nr:rhodanese-like domain-containing protein [Nitrospirota bacterium]
MKKLYSLVIGIALLITAATTASAFDNLTPVQAYDAVVNNGAYILDVRTDAEFIWVGHPNVINVLNISYKIENKDTLITNPSFISDIDEIFGAVKDTHIITMCRSGQRSVEAALALEAAGYTNVSNMVDGFEGGKKDQYGYRTINGWKNSGLPGHTSSVGADDYYSD